MNLRDLEYLVALDDLRHFRKAAERCHVSQPALSGQIKKLEEELGVALVERGGRGALPTAAGAAAVRHARAILAEADQLARLAETHGDPLRGRLRLGLIPTLAPYLLPLIVEPLRRGLPGLEVDYEEAPTAVLLARLAEGRLEAAAMALPDLPAGLAAEPLFLEPFLLAAPAGHPLAARRSVEPADLEGAPLLLLSEGHCLRGQALELCGGGADRDGGFAGTSLETLRHMVAAGMGVTLVPLSAARPDPAVRHVPFGPPAPARAVALVRRESSRRAECLARLAGLVRGAYREAHPDQNEPFRTIPVRSA